MRVVLNRSSKGLQDGDTDVAANRGVLRQYEASYHRLPPIKMKPVVEGSFAKRSLGDRTITSVRMFSLTSPVLIQSIPPPHRVKHPWWFHSSSLINDGCKTLPHSRFLRRFYA